MPPKPTMRDPLQVLIRDQSGGRTLDNARLLPLDRITPNAKQSRQAFDPVALDELAASIKEHGVLEPILVRPVGDAYQILAGERRYRAAKAVGLAEIPALIRDNLSDAEAALITALENLQRQDLDIEDEARQYQRLLAVTELSQTKLAEKLGVNVNRINRLVRFLDRPAILAGIRAGWLTMERAVAALAAGVDPEPPAAEGIPFAAPGVEPAPLVERDDLFPAESSYYIPAISSQPEMNSTAGSSMTTTTTERTVQTEPAAPPLAPSVAPPGELSPSFRRVEATLGWLKGVKARQIRQEERQHWRAQLRAISEVAKRLESELEPWKEDKEA